MPARRGCGRPPCAATLVCISLLVSTVTAFSALNGQTARISRSFIRNSLGARNAPSRLTHACGCRTRHFLALEPGSTETTAAAEPIDSLADNNEPEPQIGDVVRYPGKWADDVSLGEIKGLQYIAARNTWIADVLPLKEIGDGQYARRRGWGTNVEDVEKLRPVRAFYVRSVDAFQVRTNSDDPGDLVYAGPCYNIKDFELPPPPPVDSASAEMSLAEYEALKVRLLRDTLLFGAAGSVAAALAVGIEEGAVFALGAATAAAYVALLGRNADKIGTGGDSTLSAGRSRGSKALDATRLALPVLLVVGLAAIHYIQSPGDVRLFNAVPRNQFAAAMLGFLTSYRLPLLYRELSRAAELDELTGSMPGSLAAGSRLLRQARDKQQSEAMAAVTAGPAGVPVVVVSGPRGLGRDALVDKLATNGGVRLPVWCTTRPQKEGEVEGVDYYFLSPVRFEEEVKGMGERSGFLQVRQHSGESYGLRASEVVKEDVNGAVTVLNADCDLVKQLVTLEGIVIIGVWVSLDSLGAIEARLRAVLTEQEGWATDTDEDRARLDQEVAGRAKQAVEDIEFGVTSNIFEFTIIDTDQEASLGKLQKALAYAR
ncbi:P-loop containing nucleoside triphosphate hydrolase protein [Tribonema minus]|uniref:P-loop containing nucleoside triphosphate hydrolase protein n=1 Tax=Tribonema minus TaxID=303371 RepID=A0A835YPD8_9STRA|nr:P-loop containing nucleoside triphosphate hydrolase protein [Tribonema minus]